MKKHNKKDLKENVKPITIEKLLDEMTRMAVEIKERKDKRKEDVKKSADVAINWLQENKGDIDALIVLAVKDQNANKENQKDGLNVISGGKSDLLDLISNISEDLLNDIISLKNKRKV